MKPSELYEFLRWYIKKGDGPPITLAGFPGIGRRTIIRDVAEEFGLEVIEVEAYEEPILDPESILLVRYFPTIKWTLGYRHFVLFNYETEDQAINEWISPVQGSLLIKIEPDFYDWKKWAYKSGVRPEVISFLNYKPENLVRILTFSSKDADMQGNGLLNSYGLLASFNSNKRKIISPKIWKFVSDSLNLKESLKRELILSSLGRIIGGEFLRFLNLYEMIKNGKTPSSVEEWYCLLGIMLEEFKGGNVEMLKKYWDKLPNNIVLTLRTDINLIRQYNKFL